MTTEPHPTELLRTENEILRELIVELREAGAKISGSIWMGHGATRTRKLLSDDKAMRAACVARIREKEQRLAKLYPKEEYGAQPESQTEPEADQQAAVTVVPGTDPSEAPAVEPAVAE